jgi:hypothetical protein
VEDIEWMLSLSAGYDAGYGFVTSFDAVEKNGGTESILALLGNWEKLRINDVFSEEEKTLFRSRDQEYHLEVLETGEWTVSPVTAHIFRRLNTERQPGEPFASNFEFESEEETQPVSFILTAEGGSVENIKFTLDNNEEVSLSVNLEKGQSIVYRSGETATLYDNSWHDIQIVDLNVAALESGPGSHSLSLSADLIGDSSMSLRIELRLSGRVVASGKDLPN